MEHINYIHLRGVCGRVTHTDDITRFSLATQRAYKGDDGTPIVETTWFECSTNDEQGADLKKGDWVELTGRIRIHKYTRMDGTDYASTEVICNTFEILPKE